MVISMKRIRQILNNMSDKELAEVLSEEFVALSVKDGKFSPCNQTKCTECDCSKINGLCSENNFYNYLLEEVE